MRPHLFAVALLACCALFVACSNDEPASPTPTGTATVATVTPQPHSPTPTPIALMSTLSVNFARDAMQVLTAAGKTIELDIELPTTEGAFQQGLMGRAPLPDTEGMLFVMSKKTDCRFWMKDTPSPLSIGFADAAGRILEIRDMTPFSTDIIQPAQPCAYALEVARGWFTRSGVSVGDRFRFPWPAEAPPPYPTG